MQGRSAIASLVASAIVSSCGPPPIASNNQPQATVAPPPPVANTLPPNVSGEARRFISANLNPVSGTFVGENGVRFRITWKHEAVEFGERWSWQTRLSYAVVQDANNQLLAQAYGMHNNERIETFSVDPRNLSIPARVSKQNGLEQDQWAVLIQCNQPRCIMADRRGAQEDLNNTAIMVETEDDARRLANAYTELIRAAGGRVSRF